MSHDAPASRNRKPVRTLLVDDEEPARQRLRQLLAPLPEVDVVGEAADGEEALEQIAALEPQLVFLDIQMPGCSGLEVASSLPSPGPRIVFCTAYDQYAVDAFELNAVDYLLKPVSRARLREALERVLARKEARTGWHRVARGQPPRRFLAKRGARYRVFPSQEVLYFGTEDGLTKLCTAQAEGWMQPTLSQLEKRLDPSCFYRVSRAAIVNLQAVAEVAPLIGGHGEAVLRNGVRLEVSRRRFKGLLRALERG